MRSYFKVNHLQSLLVRDDNDEPQQTITLELSDRVAVKALQEKIEFYVLPKTVTISGKRHDNKYWQSASEVTDEILHQATLLPLTLNPIEGDSAQAHSVSLDVTPNRTIYVHVKRGLISDGEFEMALPYRNLVQAPDYPREVQIAQDGALLPLTGSHKVNFVSRGVSTLRVEIGRLLESQVNHLASQINGDIKNPVFNSYSFDQDNLSARQTQYIDLPSSHAKTASYSHVNLSDQLSQGGYYFITVQGWDRANGYPIGGEDRRFILISDLGLMVKANADSSQHVFVHSISTGLPVSGAEVQLLGKNGRAILSGFTQYDGHTKLPATSAFSREQQPTVFVIKNGNDSLFMPFETYSRQLQYSRYDVGGEYSSPQNDQGRIRAQIFTERDLFRPGDDIHLGMIVKRDNWAPMPQLPLLFTVRDSRGQMIVEKRLKLTRDGFLEETVATDVASATGNYNAALYLVEKNNRRRHLGNHRFKVEEFQPDRLKIRSKISGHKARGWLKPDNLSVSVSLKNLFGTAAENRKVTGQLNLQPANIYFSEFEEFIFTDPLRVQSSTVRPLTKTLAANDTDKNGTAILALDLGQYDQGIYQLSVYTEGFEVGGGRSVKSRASAMLSPLDYLIGYRSSSQLGFINKDTVTTVDFIAVNSDAKAIPLDDLQLSIVEQRFVSTLVKQANGTFAYESITKEYQVSSDVYSIDEQGTSFTLPTNTSGSYAIKLQDSSGLIYSKVPFTVTGARNLAGNLEQNAELELNLDDSSYAPGSTIELQITAPYSGTGLITIEREQVLAHKWFTTDTNSTLQTIEVPADIEGNAYVNVAFVRALDSAEIFISPLSFAVQPFSINRDARTIDITLHAPEIVKPGESLDIGVQTSSASRVVVYAVDQGILQVANYSLPDPLDFFLTKMALQVKTYQLVDLILPEFSPYKRNAAPGGGDGSGLVGSNLNPFRRKSDAPVVFWSGILDAGPQSQTVSYDVPDYFNGELKIMAIAVADDAVGNAQKNATVRGAFVISPNMLTAAAPGDKFEVNVGLANALESTDQSDLIKLGVSASDHLEIVGASTVSLDVAPGREGQARFTVRAKEKLGSAFIDFTATSGKERVNLRTSVSVRPSSPYVTTLVTGNSSTTPIELSLERTLFDNYANQHAAASSSPLILADGLLDYLEAFEHACAEQIVSKVFPQIGFHRTARPSS